MLECGIELLHLIIIEFAFNNRRIHTNTLIVTSVIRVPYDDHIDQSWLCRKSTEM